MLTVLVKPIGIDRSGIRRAIITFVVLYVMMLFGAWLIREQFVSTRVIFLITGFFSASAGVSSLMSITLGGKLFTRASGVLQAVVGSIIGLIFLVPAMYLTIYHISVHYLIVIRM